MAKDMAKEVIRKDIMDEEGTDSQSTEKVELTGDESKSDEPADETSPGKTQSPEQSQEEPVKSPRLIIWSIVFILLFTVLFFSIRFFYNPEADIPTYKSQSGFEFYYTVGLWNTQFQKGDKLYNLHFHFNPEEVKSVPIVGIFDEESFNKGRVYVTFDPLANDLTYVNLAAKELVINLVRAINTNVTMACITNQSSACAGEPIITCENTDEPVIFIKEGEDALIELKETCIVLQGQDMDLLKAVDKILFKWFGML